ncbi:MAG TPA: 50S ribosomal protein L3 N(5)-glutamine methyltransferase, partial [Usitatibacter sp.]|nr:50S ribosomal protein L3 N(5)-glutamine methyltransferase [Usitatibacter sp.]
GDRPLNPLLHLQKRIKWSVPKVLDLCTGSGCLAILAALAHSDAEVDAVDLSEDALAVAARNIADYGLEDRVHPVHSDMFSALHGRTYDLIVSNPPYVKASSMRKLPEEYRREPSLALASGADGLDHTRVILARARKHLAPGGQLVVEIGHNRTALTKAYPDLPFRWPRTSGGRGFVFTLAREDLPAKPRMAAPRRKAHP